MSAKGVIKGIGIYRFILRMRCITRILSSDIFSGGNWSCCYNCRGTALHFAKIRRGKYILKIVVIKSPRLLTPFLKRLFRVKKNNSWQFCGNGYALPLFCLQIKTLFQSKSVLDYYWYWCYYIFVKMRLYKKHFLNKSTKRKRIK